MKFWTIEEKQSLVVGDKIRSNFGESSRSNRLYHFRGMIDNQVVVKYWGGTGRGWLYRMFGEYELVHESYTKEP